MPEFVSEPVKPLPGAFDTAGMGRGEPGLPAGFNWRDADYTIIRRLGQWKLSTPDRTGEVYLRRHYYELQMSDGARWTVYFVRQTPKSGSPKTRWFLYSLEPMTSNEPHP
jgi:hypothetical protein